MIEEVSNIVVSGLYACNFIGGGWRVGTRGRSWGRIRRGRNGGNSDSRRGADDAGEDFAAGGRRSSGGMNDSGRGRRR